MLAQNYEILYSQKKVFLGNVSSLEFLKKKLKVFTKTRDGQNGIHNNKSAQ